MTDIVGRLMTVTKAVAGHSYHLLFKTHDCCKNAQCMADGHLNES